MDKIDLITTICLVFWSIVFIYLYCECGEGVTDQFNQFNDELDQCNWYICYLFPIKLQRMLIVVIIDAQYPAVIRGYANTTCTRDSFKKVRSTHRNGA